MAGVFSTPRPVPNRRVPALAGAGVVALSLPVFLVGGFPVAGWVLAAVLWVAGEALGFWLSRLPTGADHLRMSGLVAIAMAFRGIGVMMARGLKPDDLVLSSRFVSPFEKIPPEMKSRVSLNL